MSARWRSTRTNCASTCTGPPGRADSARTPPTPRSGSPTCPRASSSRCRTRNPRSRTGKQRCGFCVRACARRSRRNSRRSNRRRGVPRCVPLTAPSASAPTTSPRTGSPITAPTTSPTTPTTCSTGTSTRWCGPRSNWTKRNALPTPASSNTGQAMRQVLSAAAAHLEHAGVPAARVDAELLAAHVCGLGRSELLLTREFPGALLGRYWQLLERRAAREPLQHLTGETGFRYLTLEVRAGVFVPRPETEMVAEAAILAAQGATRAAAAGAPGPVRIVDLCTGAGGIALACAQEVPGAQVWAVDLSPEAVALTRANAERNALTVSVLEGDVHDAALLTELHGTVDVVVSNPPYIPFECEPLEAEVRDYDPPAALYGGGVDGLAVPIAVIHRARALLRPGGTLIIEHGDGQGRAMREHVERQGGFQEIHTQQDLTNRDRMVVAARDQVAH